VQLVRFEPGQVICKEGDAADCFFLVRIGFVQGQPDGHGPARIVLSLSAQGLALRRDGSPRRAESAEPTCIALDPRGAGEHSGGMISSSCSKNFRGVRSAMEAVASARKAPET